jgi:RNA recognition motif-containing protein
MAGTRTATKLEENGITENGAGTEMTTSYEEIMGIQAEDAETGGGAQALTARLTTFRDWVSEEAKIVVHPAVCVVNGEATDGTKNAPVLIFGPPPGSQPLSKNAAAGRVGMVDGEADRALYERTMGCQVRAAREIKKDQVMMTVPRSAMITADVVASSDAGRALSACCQAAKVDGEPSYWDTFENTTVCESKFAQKVMRNTGTQLLVKILQERKRAETAFNRAMQELENPADDSKPATQHKLVPSGEISSRAPILAFLIHQRFSSDPRPPVNSDAAEDNFEKIKQEDGEANAVSSAKRIKPLPDSPVSFGPYARTLPSSVSLPMCWKRNELALLAGCIPGISPLQEIAARTLQLASEFVALIDGGILSRFPSIFPRGLLTWERWMWAASVFTSRVLPVTCYLNSGEVDAMSHVPRGGEEIMQSPREVFDELGVMVPLLDMVNHETDAHQVSWKPCVPKAENANMNGDAMGDSDSEPDDNSHPPRAIAHKRIKKGEQIYCNYGGDLSNEILILQYGFAELGNKSDEARLGWGLMDAVGGVAPPDDYEAPFEATEGTSNENFEKSKVFESMESTAVNDWWSDDRLALLEQEAFPSVDNSFMSSLKMGKKMMGAAHSDGTYHPILLTAAVVGTIPPPELSIHMSKSKAEENEKTSLVVTRRHQHVLRSYLTFIFTRKLEKLLENLNNGLKGHFGALQLWTKASRSGIRYKATEAEKEESENPCIGWQTFFEEHAYSATMEVEKRYYAMGPDSCVLTLYDGQLQSLQASLDGLSTPEKFASGILKQLEDLGFTIGAEADDAPADFQIVDEDAAKTLNGTTNKAGPKQGDDKQTHKKNDAGKKKDDGKKKDEGKPSPSKNRRRNRKRNNNALSNPDRPPAIKLHIGNLAYSTTPSDLYDYFSGMYGRESVLECHIPTERDTGKSRGFGFVTLPEPLARSALESGRKHEVDGRLLKIAESNSAGAGKPNRPVIPPPAPVSGDRCATCGYRPKYCVCSVPNLPGHPGNRDAGYREDDYARSSKRHRGDRYSRSRSPYYRDRRGGRDEYDRGYGRDHRYNDREKSRSPSRGRDRDRSSRRRSSDRSRDRSKDRSRDQDRSKDRSRERSAGISRDSRRSGRHGSRSRGSERALDHRSSRGSSRPRSRSRSPSYTGSSRRERKAAGSSADKERRGERKSSLSPSPELSRPNAASADAAREGRKQRSSRSRSPRRSRKSRKKKRHTRSRSRSASPVEVAKK